jgi:hypothetical protein
MLVPFILNQQYMKPGSIVVCVNDQFSEEAKERLNVFPKKGYSYKIKALVPDPMGNHAPGLVLEGLSNPIGWVACKSGLVLVEYSFKADRFAIAENTEETWANPEVRSDIFLSLKSIKN